MTDQQYIEVTKRIFELMQKSDLTPREGAELDRLIVATEAYERLHYPIGEDEI